MYVYIETEIIALSPETAPINQEVIVKRPGEYIEMTCVITSGTQNATLIG